VSLVQGHEQALLLASRELRREAVSLRRQFLPGSEHGQERLQAGGAARPSGQQGLNVVEGQEEGARILVQDTVTVSDQEERQAGEDAYVLAFQEVARDV
jgi:hypothetical protein